MLFFASLVYPDIKLIALFSAKAPPSNKHRPLISATHGSTASNSEFK